MSSKNNSFTKLCVKWRTKKDCKLHRCNAFSAYPSLHRFDAWIRAVDAYSGNDLLYLNPSGVLPDSAIITKGIRRQNPFRERKVFDTTGFTGHEIGTKLEDDDEGAEIDGQNLEETEG
jgi:hypothetical protein